MTSIKVDRSIINLTAVPCLYNSNSELLISAHWNIFLMLYFKTKSPMCCFGFEYSYNLCAVLVCVSAGTLYSGVQV